MTKETIMYIAMFAVFVVLGAFLLGWCVIDVGSEKKTVSEGHFLIKGYVIGFVVCALVTIMAQTL